MHIDTTPEQARTILAAMLAVARAGPSVTDADRASLIAAARYIFKIELPPDLNALAPPSTEALAALAATPELAAEAVRFATVMTFVDGTTSVSRSTSLPALPKAPATRKNSGTPGHVASA